MEQPLGCYIVAALVHLLRRLYVRLSSRGAAALEAELAHPWKKLGAQLGSAVAAMAPDGLNMALPDWLPHLGMFVAIILYVVKMVTANDEAAAAAQGGGGGSLSVAGADSQYLQCLLDDASTHEDVLYFIATTPENLHCAKRSIVEAAKQKHDDGGWDDDAGEKDAATSEQEAAAAQRAKAFGFTPPDKIEYKVEGLHPGVLGQTWVENRLAELGVWPPQMTNFSKNAMVRQIMAAGRGENDDGTEPEVDLLRAPHARRNICYVVACLNAHQLITSCGTGYTGGRSS